MVTTYLLLTSYNSSSSSSGGRLGAGTSLRNTIVNMRLNAADSNLTARLRGGKSNAGMRQCGGKTSTVRTLLRNGVSYVIASRTPTGTFRQIGPSLHVLPRAFSTSSFTVYITGSRTRLRRSVGRTVHVLGTGNIVSSVIGHRLRQNVTITCAPGASSIGGIKPRTLRGLKLGGDLHFTAGTAFRPFRCCRSNGVINVSMSITGTVNSIVNISIRVLSVRFSTVVASMRTNGTSTNVTNVAIAPRQRGGVKFASSCTSIQRIVVMGSRGTRMTSTRRKFLSGFGSYFVSSGHCRCLLRKLNGALVVAFFTVVLSIVLNALVTVIHTHRRHQNN